MIVIDPGHLYTLNILDADKGGYRDGFDHLQFVKRMGPNFPGNTSAYPGTTVQENLRACCDRLRYVAHQGELLGQIENPHTHNALFNVQLAIQSLEIRAAIRHCRSGDISLRLAEFGKLCEKCGHVGCDSACH